MAFFIISYVAVHFNQICFPCTNINVFEFDSSCYSIKQFLINSMPRILDFSIPSENAFAGLGIVQATISEFASISDGEVVPRRFLATMNQLLQATEDDKRLLSFLFPLL